MPTWKTSSDWDTNQSESGVHHEQPPGTSWAPADVVEKGYPSSAQGLDVYWPLNKDNSGTTPDVAGSMTGSVIGTSEQSGLLGQDSLYFDGNDNIAGSPIPTHGSDAFTISLWIEPDSENTDMSICGPDFFNDQSVGDDKNTGFRYDSSGFVGGGSNLIKFGLLTTGNTIWNGESVSNTQTTDWQHIAFTWSSGNEPNYYLDGSLGSWKVSDGSLSGSVSFSDIEGRSIPKSFAIGAGIKPSSGLFEGKARDLRVYNRELSSSEVQSLNDVVDGTSTLTTGTKQL